MKLKKFKHPPLFLVTYWNFIYSLVIFFFTTFLFFFGSFSASLKKIARKENAATHGSKEVNIDKVGYF
jgi:uncharacterized membrane protein